jgi:site-specific recombinase XerD
MEFSANETPTLPAVVPVGGTLGPVVEAAQKYVEMSQAPNTRRAYQSDWADFENWCREHQLASFPATPEVVGLYAAALAEAGRKISTIERRLAAIAKQHRDHGHHSPCSMKYSQICEVINGIRRSKGVRPAAKQALSTDQLRLMVEALPKTPRGLRDRALLLIGFAGGFRRSELAPLNIENVIDTEDGLKILIRRSKTDQEGEGRTIGVPYGSDPRTCPVRAFRAWIKESGISAGPIFRHFYGRKMCEQAITPHTVARVIKGAAERAGIDATELSGHSLRCGLATTAARNGASERSIMRQTGHKSVQMVRRYIREGELFIDNAASKLGL